METKPKRPWYQFSLRSLFVLVTLLCAGLGFYMQKVRPVQRQRAAVADLNPDQFSNFTRYDYEGVGGYKSPKGMRLNAETGQWETASPPGPAWLRDIVGIDWFADVVSAEVGGDSGMQHVQAFPKLKSLVVYPPVTPRGLAVLDQLHKLESLVFERTQVHEEVVGRYIDDEGLQHVRGLTKLRLLSLSMMPITDEGLKALAELKQLEWLALEYTQVKGPGLANLKGLRRLKTLRIYASGLTDDYWKHGKWPRRHPGISDQYLKHLEPLTELEYLQLDGFGITDAGLVHLKKLTKLKVLLLSDTSTTEAGRRALWRALPSLDWGPRDADVMPDKPE